MSEQVPGLDYGKLGTVNKGQTLTYAGDTRYDNRGVAWYSVYYNRKTGWVSSKYASVQRAALRERAVPPEKPVPAPVHQRKML